ncbi:MAG TPA: lamin tail domain-containing protein, partial [Candidatus Binatia bacterium]|nr:lamin tail domain-containing protein [Candidatus Binatia bacterium]
MNASKVLLCTWIFLFSAMAGARAADNVLITEFMAVNNGTLLDENGDAEDWIELHNAGTNVVNLDGWFLTDKSTQLTQWRFPATNFPPGTYMIVWASSKNRRVPGAPLHTNFRLNNEGEYLALVRPDGITIASSYPPPFSPQVNGVSYGFPVAPMTTTLIPTGAVARVLVPTDASLDSSWMTPSFDHSAWAALPTGIGYEKDGVTPFVPVTLANSVTEFSGTQGLNNWFYGYWNQETDADSVYSPGDFVSFPNGGGGWSANNFWTGANWDWFAGDPPFTQLTADGGRPSGDNGAEGVTNQWAIRRYVSETNGPLAISGRITHTSDWVYVTQSGVAGTGLLYLYLQNAGEGYIDDVKVVAGLTPEAGINLLSNGDFESPAINPWNVTANMSASTVSTTVKHGGTRSLHLVAAGAGSTQTDSIWQSFTVVSGGIYTLSYWYLPITNNPPGVVRASGSWFNTTATGSGDGVVARIIVDGTEVLRQPAFVSSVEYSVSVPVNIGSKVDFTLDAGSVNNSTGDFATFTAALATADPTLMTVADTETDWSFGGVQGEKNWYYGYYNKSGDADATYQATNFVAFPRSNGPQGTNNFWDEQEWDWPSGDPPFDKIGQYWMIPNGTNSGAQHWVIKRWLSEANGTITVNWSALKELPDQNNPGGGGATVRIFHNGIQRDSAVIPGGDTVGVQRSVTISNVVAGDPIDIALDPTNVDGRPHGDTDKTLIKVTIRGSPSLATFVRSDIGAQMQGINSSAYIRIPFNVTTPSAFNLLTLRTKYDDGLVAYLNGVEVARANAPLTPVWNSTAVAERPDAENNLWQEWNLTESLGLLRAGSNVLAIQGLNITAQDSDFLILPELVAGTVTNDVTARRYFLVPTPGAANGVGSSNIGPQVVEASHSPAIPQDGENLAVIAHVSPTLNPLGSVQLVYRVMFSNEVTVPMFDDGAHGDGAAADGTWGATIPATASNPGQMVRYYVYATDSQGNGTRLPSFLEPKNSPQYFGTVVVDPSLTNQ